jgi:acetyl-CoA acyltransferase
MRLVAFAFAGVQPELMGIGPIPATKRVLEQTGLTMDDIGLFELNEPFAVQVLSWCDGMGIDPEDPRLNPYGGAIACGHPLAATGVRLMAQLAYGLRERPDVRYGLTALCVGMGMGAALLWEAAQPPVRDSGPVEGARGNREVPPTGERDAGH